MKKLISPLAAFIFLILILSLLSRGFNLFQQKNYPPKAEKLIEKSIKDGQIVLAAGDIGDCTPKVTAATQTAKLLDLFSSPILTLGDNAYPDGTKEDFETCFNSTWGKYKDKIFPSVGNHEYHTKDAKPYFDYFGKRAGDFPGGYYSFNLRNWHLISLNTIIMANDSRCSLPNDVCEGASEQWQWLKKDLEQNKTDCTLIYGHYPLFSSSAPNATLGMTPLWELAYLENVDIILAGHDHEYERFAPQDPTGKLDQKQGIREFVVGTGGGELGGHGDPAKNSEIVTNSKHGILKLVLGKGEYEWEFLSTDGSFVDKGRDACH